MYLLLIRYRIVSSLSYITFLTFFIIIPYFMLFLMATLVVVTLVAFRDVYRVMTWVFSLIISLISITF